MREQAILNINSPLYRSIMSSINYQTAKFLKSYGTAEQLPAPTHPEVSFVGRSNVGKSSLLNKLFNRRNLAKVSSVPGKTTCINFFEADGIQFVDLPGYGFAKRSNTEKQRWANLINGYFEDDRSHNLIVSLIDIRHDATKQDIQMIDYIKEFDFPFVVALTKSDKLSRTQQNRQIDLLKSQLDIESNTVIATSSQTGLGLENLKTVIANSCL